MITKIHLFLYRFPPYASSCVQLFMHAQYLWSYAQISPPPSSPAPPKALILLEKPALEAL